MHHIFSGMYMVRSCRQEELEIYLTTDEKNLPLWTFSQQPLAASQFLKLALDPQGSC
jgi:hypothetical protein